MSGILSRSLPCWMIWVRWGANYAALDTPWTLLGGDQDSTSAALAGWDGSFAGITSRQSTRINMVRFFIQRLLACRLPGPPLFSRNTDAITPTIAAGSGSWPIEWY